MKLCVDCRFHRPFADRGHLCAWRDINEPVKLSPVTGRPYMVDVSSCEHERRIEGRCGLDAKHFEPKPPLPADWNEPAPAAEHRRPIDWLRGVIWK